ncbi:macro domain-containing protein [Roseibium sp.]|uniref:macro domain-containing protein n=1 Tax=Roseibium sp. TaxID=1936156 RepID=UPI00391A7942
MPVEFKSGNIFVGRTEAIVNAVNCIGVMGKGIALEFKRRWPDYFADYKSRCKRKSILTGQVTVYESNNLLAAEEFRYLISFPTKLHWRTPSKIEFIDTGLADLTEKTVEFGIKSMALPALGCGNGGLDWSEVKPIIQARLSTVPDVRFLVFTPADTPAHQT